MLLAPLLHLLLRGRAEGEPLHLLPILVGPRLRPQASRSHSGEVSAQPSRRGALTSQSTFVTPSVRMGKDSLRPSNGSNASRRPGDAPSNGCAPPAQDAQKPLGSEVRCQRRSKLQRTWSDVLFRERWGMRLFRKRTEPLGTCRRAQPHAFTAPCWASAPTTTGAHLASDNVLVEVALENLAHLLLRQVNVPSASHTAGVVARWPPPPQRATSSAYPSPPPPRQRGVSRRRPYRVRFDGHGAPPG